MERDFMGIGGRDQLLLLEEEPRGSCGTSVHRPLPTKASTLQQFMPFKPAAPQDQKLKPSAFDHVPTTAFHPVLGLDAHHKMIPQKSFSMGSQGAKTYPPQGFSSQGANRYDVPMNQPNLHLSTDPRMPPMAFSGRYFRACNPGMGSGQALPASRQQKMPGPGPNFAPPAFSYANGTVIPRDKSNSIPATAQLTIFYGGYVNVYDNVPLEKAQAIMFMAANSSSMVPNPPILRSQAPVQAPTKLAVAPESMKMGITLPKPSTASPRSGFSSPISAVSHSAAHSTSSSNNPDERKGHTTADTRHEPVKMPPANGDATCPSTISVSKPVPMMRKRSLVRFLEKRKERFTNPSPYPFNKPFQSPKSSSPAGGTQPEIGNSNGKEWSWQSSTSKNLSDDKPPNTKLEI